VFATTFFTQGAGVAYGDALYAAQIPDVDSLDAELARLFAKLRAPTISRTAEKRALTAASVG
jgi:hypothetical protein